MRWASSPRGERECKWRLRGAVTNNSVRNKNGDGIRCKTKLTTNGADRGGRVGEAHVLKARVRVVGVDIGRIHQFRGLAVFESEMFEGGLHCRL
jgi:hypothetical protein